ncbi:hypothetical protein D3C80_1434540 [compost metagenome]
MVGAVGGHDLPGRGTDGVAGQLAHQALAQARVAQAVAIAEQVASAAAHRLPGEFVEAHVLQPGHRRKTFTQRRQPGFANELLTHHPDGVHCPGVRRRLIHFGGLHLRTHEKALAVARLHQPLGGEDLVSGYHRILRMPVQAHVFAQRWQAIADLQPPSTDLLLNRIGDLLGESDTGHRRAPGLSGVQSGYCWAKLYL